MEYTDMERRILDMWPKYEDGEYVMYEDEFDFDGEVKTAYGFNFGVGGRVSICSDKGSHVRLPNGERVKRPAPKVLDADGVEIKVGDTVWHAYGSEWLVEELNRYGVRCFDGAKRRTFSPTFLTHTRPESWERLEEDAKKGNCEYLGRSQSSCDGCCLNGKSACDEYVRIDLVRRAKALAEKEAARLATTSTCATP